MKAILITIAVLLSFGISDAQMLAQNASPNLEDVTERLIQGSPWVSNATTWDGRSISFTLEFWREGKEVRGKIAAESNPGFKPAVGELRWLKVEEKVTFTSPTGSNWELKPTDKGFEGTSASRQTLHPVRHKLVPTKPSSSRDMTYDLLLALCEEEVAPNAYPSPDGRRCENPDNTHR